MRQTCLSLALFFLLLFWTHVPLRAETHNPAEIRSLYLSTDNLHNSRKIAELEHLIRATSANGIVIDFKDSNKPDLEYIKKLVTRFRNAGSYTIARIVTFQDKYFAQKNPEIAIRTKTGTFWWSGAQKWQRYWVDPASELAQNYAIEIAKRAIDCGFDEIQFDYVRFPTDGNMKNIVYPVFKPEQTKSAVMEQFFKKMRHELNIYAPDILIGIDLFGEVFLYGRERGIGQDLADVAHYFDVLSPMAYPTHYQCGTFKVKDPSAHPYLVYSTTLGNGLKFLNGKKVIIRPWIQAFTLRNIYGCGPSILYTPAMIKQQIKAGTDLGINGFMLWNVGNNFSPEIFE